MNTPDPSALLTNIDKGSRYTKLDTTDDFPKRTMLHPDDYDHLRYLFDRISSGTRAVIIIEHDASKKKYMLSSCAPVDAFDMMHAVQVDLLKKAQNGDRG